MRVWVYVVKSSDGAFYGLWGDVDEAETWAEEHENEIGDWLVEEVFEVNNNSNRKESL